MIPEVPEDRLLFHFATWFLAALLPLAPGPDQLVLADGTELTGTFVEDTGTHVLFQVDGEDKPRRLAHDKVRALRPSFEHAAPALTAEWSEAEVQAKIREKFTEEEQPEVVVVRSEHYILFSTAPSGSRDKGAKKFVQRDMELIYEGFAETFPFEEPEDSRLMAVYLLKDHEQYVQWSMRSLGWTYEVARQSAGHAARGYFATYFTGSAASDPTVWHEAGHQLVSERLRIHGGGSWFQEGMAVYFEQKYTKGDRLDTGSRTNATPFRELFEVPSLLHTPGDSTRGSAAGMRYRQSGTIIYFLAEGPWKDKFGTFLERVRDWRAARGETRSGTMWDRIFQELYGLDVDGVEKAWREF